jgi:hypothetical protein
LGEAIFGQVMVSVRHLKELMTNPVQSHSVEHLLSEIETDADHMRRYLIEFLTPAGAPIFSLDLLAFAAVNRHSSTTTAFTMMVRSWNMVIARALLRMHIDTSLRFSAAWHVNEPHEFADCVIKGQRIDKMKSREGARLTDAHLVELHKESHPWLPDVYEHLSGYVHFSSAHVSNAVKSVCSEEAFTMELLVSDQDLKYPEHSWIEILECFRETSSILDKFLRGWIQSKMSPGSS